MKTYTPDDEVKIVEAYEQNYKKPRGFAAISKERQREIAAMGGKIAHQRGNAHEWDSNSAREAGKKGGRRGKRR